MSFAACFWLKNGLPRQGEMLQSNSRLLGSLQELYMKGDRFLGFSDFFPIGEVAWTMILQTAVKGNLQSG